jgi:phosphatidylserine synthase
VDLSPATPIDELRRVMATAQSRFRKAGHCENARKYSVIIFTMGIAINMLSHFEYPAFEKMTQNGMIIMIANMTHMIGPNPKNPIGIP